MPNKNYLVKYESLILKLFAFIGLGIAGYIDVIYSENTLLEDPVSIGSFAMAVATVVTLINPKVYYIHTVMFFFIFTKLVSQYTHSEHYTFWGQLRH
jgi:hypothetical protein